jgi:hypothetical protein
MVEATKKGGMRASVCLLICYFWHAFAPSPSHAQENIIIQNFRVPPEFYPSPNQRQMKYLLEGARAQPETGGRYSITDAKLTMFQTNGHQRASVYLRADHSHCPFAGSVAR